MLVNPTYRQILHVAQNMRELDWREIRALRFSGDPHSLAHDIAMFTSPQWLALHEDEPVYLFGIQDREPGDIGCWGFGTERWPKVAMTVSKFLKGTLFPAIAEEAKIKRMTCLSLAEKTDAQRWMKWLGFKEIPTQEFLNYGPTGEDFKLLVWETGNVLQQAGQGQERGTAAGAGYARHETSQ